MTGPEACPSPGPTSPGGGGPGAGLGAALTCPRPPLPPTPSAPLSLPCRRPSLPRDQRSPSVGAAARSRLGGRESSWRGVGPLAGNPGPLGTGLFTPFGPGTRERALDRLGGRSLKMRCLEARLAQVGSACCRPGRHGWRLPPSSLCSSLILPLPRIPAHPFCNVLKPGSAGLGRVSGNFSTPFQTSHHLDLARTYSDTLYLSPALGHPSHPAQSSARVPTGRGKCDP